MFTVGTKRPAEGALSRPTAQPSAANFFSQARRSRPSVASQGPTNYPRIWSSFIENVCEDEDFGEALMAMEGMVGERFVPLPDTVRQVMALALSPASCLAPSSTLSRHLAPPSLDPFLATSRKIRNESLRLLQDIGATNGGEALARASPGYVADLSLARGVGGPSLVVDVFGSKGGRKDGARSLPTPPKEEQGFPDDIDDTALALAGKRVARCEDVWELLGGAAGRGKGFKYRTRERPVVRGGWELLRVFVEVWEAEGEGRKARGESEVSPSLLRQFPEKHYGVRTLSAKVTDVIFWPFSDLSSEREDRKDEIPIDDDEMELEEKKVVALRLAALVGQLALANLLDPESTLRETCVLLKSLPHPSFLSFLSLLSTTPSQFYTLKLTSTYLSLYSTSSLPLLPPLNASPRRRPLGPTHSFPSLESPTSSQSQPLPSTSSHPFIPSPESIKRLMSRTALEGGEGGEEGERLRVVKEVLWESCMTAAMGVGGDVWMGFERIGESVGDMLEREM